MTERQAAETSMHEYQLRLKGKEREIQREWELTRWQTWQMMRPNFKKGSEPKTPQAFVRFPWEQPEADEAREKMERSRVTEAQAAVLNRIFDEIHKRNQVES